MLEKVLIGAVAVVLLGGVIAWWLLWSPTPSLPSIGYEAIKVGNMERRYLAFIPDRLPTGAPLLIVLHGTGQDGDTIRHYTGGRFEELARQHGFAVAYPDGVEKQWNDCRPKEARLDAIDDVGFIEGIVANLATKGIDPEKVFLFGYSNGGQMVFRLLSERPDSFQGAATMGANLPTSEFNTCSDDKPTPPLLLAQGMKDPIVPFDGGRVTIFGLIDRGQALSAKDTAEAFAARNGLNDTRSNDLEPGIARWQWTGTPAVTVERLAFSDAGHVVPQPRFRFPRIMGPTPSFDLPQYVIDFFRLGAT